MLTTSLFKIQRLTPQTSRVILPGDVFAYIVEGDDRAAVIDTGCGLGPFRAFVEAALRGKPYDVLLTHGHVDHAGGASEFDRVWLNPRDWPIVTKHTKLNRRMGYLRRSFTEPFTEADMPRPLTDTHTCAPLEWGQVFDLGGERIEIVNLGGHTPGSVGLLFQRQRTLLAGDACCSYTLLFAGGASLSVREYRDNLSRAWALCRDRIDHMLYSHPHNYGGPEVIPQMVEVCDSVLAGADARIPVESQFGPALLARAVDAHDRRMDGGIANLLYTTDNMQ